MAQSFSISQRPPWTPNNQSRSQDSVEVNTNLRVSSPSKIARNSTGILIDPPPESCPVVTLLHATNVPSMDILSSSDAYVSMQVRICPFMGLVWWSVAETLACGRGRRLLEPLPTLTMSPPRSLLSCPPFAYRIAVQLFGSSGNPRSGIVFWPPRNNTAFPVWNSVRGHPSCASFLHTTSP